MRNFGVYVIPVISLVLSLFLTLFAGVSLTFVLIGSVDTYIRALGITFSVISIIASGMLFLFSLLFIAKSKLCRVATGIYAVALSLSIAAVVLM